jgi:hypothetical protein
MIKKYKDGGDVNDTSNVHYVFGNISNTKRDKILERIVQIEREKLPN